MEREREIVGVCCAKYFHCRHQCLSKSVADLFEKVKWIWKV